MANITDNAVTDGAVVASLQRIPGKREFRLNFEIATARPKDLPQHAFETFPISLEVDASRLRTLKFTQQELAEIGFGLLSRLSTLVKYDA
jgi:hypothetical protein